MKNSRADAFYDQIKQMTMKLNDLKLAKEKLVTKEMDLKGQDIDQHGLKTKIERTLGNLEKAPKEKQRSIFTNLVKFIEIHPMKIKIGILAPSKNNDCRSGTGALKATGTDGQPTQNSNSGKKEGTIIPFDPNRRGGSTSVTIGALLRA